MIFCRPNIGLKTLWAFFILFAAMQATWLLLDQRTLVVERHFLAAAQIAHELRHDNVGAQYPEHGFISPYPPFLAYWSAPGLALFGINGDIAVLTLLPFAWLLIWSVWKTARLFMPPHSAVAAAALTLAFHHAMVTEPNYPAYSLMKEYLLDMPLSAFTAWSLYLMLRAREHSSLCYGLGLGAAIGFGALTKVSFPFYLAILIAAVFLGTSAPRPPWRRWLLPAAIAAVIALPWYARHAPDLLEAFLRHELNSAWAAECGMPPIFSAAGILYAGKTLLHLMSWPLALAAAAALALLPFRKQHGWKLILAGALLSLAALLPIWGKGERLFAPTMLFPAIAIAIVFNSPSRVPTGNLFASILIAAAIAKIALMNGFVPKVLLNNMPETIRTEPAPSGNDWAIDALLNDMEKQGDKTLLLKTAVIPFLGHFRHASFQQAAGARGMRIAPESDWTMRGEQWLKDIDATEFIITKTGAQGPARFAPNAEPIAEWIRSNQGSAISKVSEYPLPDGSVAVLWHHERVFQTFSRVKSKRPQAFLASFEESIKLLGYEIRREQEELLLRFQWWCDAPPRQDARLFIQVRQGYHNLAKESYTPGAGLYPTAIWKQGMILDETYSLPLYAESLDGDHDIWIGWHRRNKRLGVHDSIFPLFIKAICIGKTSPRRQGTLATMASDETITSPLKLPPLPGR